MFLSSNFKDFIFTFSFSNNCKIAFPRVDLPEPDSPTIPIVCPCFIDNEISFTACKIDSGVPKKDFLK